MEGADLVVAEATYLDADADVADAHFHMTARQAATLARRAGARRLVLTHFSQRYTDLTPFRVEAEDAFGGEVVVADDLTRVSAPPRR
jgi:ribonuclease Z